MVAYAGLKLYYGDIHNHCGLSYGKGSLDEALHNARLQLDFASVTLHGHWDDMPKGDPRLDYLVDYHQVGFARASAAWGDYLSAMDAANSAGEFVTFPSFEWHSMRYGDHCVYFRDSATPQIFHVAHLEDLRARLRRHPHPSLLIPHHIGYRQGFRGINWNSFSSELSPVVEIMSFHGAAEATDAEPAYLHAMGPRDHNSSAQRGLELGHIFGFIGSSDDHSAHPGNYGYGLAAVWAEDLSRAAIWDAICRRRTYAVTGDRIGLQFALNGQPMGAVLPYCAERHIEIAVDAAATIDTIDILRNNRVIQREALAPSRYDGSGPCKLRLEMGWGESEFLSDWDVQLSVAGGELLAVEPHLRGKDIAMPDLEADDSCVWSRFSMEAGEAGEAGESWESGGTVRLRTRSPRNATVRSAATQALTLHIEGGYDTLVHARINDMEMSLTLAELSCGARAGYTSGFVSPAFVFHRAVPVSDSQRRLSFADVSDGEERDWYYARVRQRNGQWAWSSPIWVERADA